MVFRNKQEVFSWLEECRVYESILVSRNSFKNVATAINELSKGKANLTEKNTEKVNLVVNGKNITITIKKKDVS